MEPRGPKAVSVLESGEADGWVPEPGWYPEMTPQGETRITVSVGIDRIVEVHRALVEAMEAPLSVLYRQKIDRAAVEQGMTPPQGAPPRDFVGVDLPTGRVVAALESCADLVYGDARCEVWIRGARHDQIVLDEDGVLYAYPDDPAFRDALTGLDLPERDVDTMRDRDYVKHWFRAECDAIERRLSNQLGLTEVPHRRG
ncbi:MAG: hypothetical protein AAF602_03605 [Myxococcota bacterium]